MYRNLIYQVSNGIASITINRPERLNALDRTTISELAGVIDDVSSDDSIRAVVMTGAGGRAFVAGADIRELALLSATEGEAYSRAGQHVMDGLERLGTPVIAAVNGFALGGGLELAMACTIRIASETAMLGQPEVGLGLIPGFGGTQRLPRLVGKGVALELLLTGKPIDARRAHGIGLVNAVVPAADLPEASRKLAETISSNGADAVRRCMEAVTVGVDGTLERGLEIEARLFGDSCASDDARHRTLAFLTKTKA